jgi:hypothetical protein
MSPSEANKGHSRLPTCSANTSSRATASWNKSPCIKPPMAFRLLQLCQLVELSINDFAHTSDIFNVRPGFIFLGSRTTLDKTPRRKRLEVARDTD